MNILGTKGVTVCFCKSVEFPQCFDDLELIKLLRTIGYTNAQVGKSILSCLAHRIRLLMNMGNKSASRNDKLDLEVL